MINMTGCVSWLFVGYMKVYAAPLLNCSDSENKCGELCNPYLP